MKRLILDSCRLMLAPAIRLLLRAGIGWAEFASIAKQSFVEVAREDYGLQGRPTNSARVAMMTGLSRREVARIKTELLSDKADRTTGSSRISQVLSGWHIDPEFLDSEGQPAKLPETGGGPSLDSLLDRYGGDMPRRALVKEMRQLGLIAIENGQATVKARDYIRSPADPDMLRQGSLAIRDHANAVVHNVNAGPDDKLRFERMATQVDVDPRDAEEFEEYLAERGQAFLEEMDRWLANRKSGSGRSGVQRRPVRTGVGMYLIYDESQGNESNA